LKNASHPLDFIGKTLNSTLFLAAVALAIACLVGWAIWRG